MSRHEHIIHVLAGIQCRAFIHAINHGGKAVENLDTRVLQFHTHGNRQQSPDHARANGEDQVHRADVLVVG